MAVTGHGQAMAQCHRNILRPESASNDSTGIVLINKDHTTTGSSPTGEDVAARGDIEPALSIEGHGKVIDAGDSIRIEEGSVRLVVQHQEVARPHAVLYRWSVDNGEHWTAWQRAAAFEAQFRQFGAHTIKLELIDDTGERLGPWRFHIERAFPLGLVSALALAILALIVIVAVLVKARTKRRHAG